MSKTIKNLVVTFLASAFTIVVVYGGWYAMGNVLAEDYDFEDPSGYFFDVKANYHKKMNEFFNDKLKVLVESLDSLEFVEGKKFEFPKELKAPDVELTLDNFEEHCEGNVSTYCVSMGALDLYIRYVLVLNQMKGLLPSGEVPEGTTGKELLDLFNDRNRDIDKELDEAKQVMEATVGAYDEFHTAYPMHQQYKVIIRNLIRYKRALGDVADTTRAYPSKFHDATTSECK